MIPLWTSMLQPMASAVIGRSSGRRQRMSRSPPITALEPLPDADDDDPAWLRDATWERAEFLLAAADAIGERRLVRAIAPLFQRAAVGDGYEMMQGLRHGPNAP